MKRTLTIQNPEKIKSYFLRVRELRSSGVKYPVLLDDVWPLVYSQKKVALRILDSEYIENEDYGVFPENGENLGQSLLRQKAEQTTGHFLLHQNVQQRSGRGGHNKKDVRLSVSCMEHLIARKHKAIFEVYRQVFHKAMDEAEAGTGLSQLQKWQGEQMQLILELQSQLDKVREDYIRNDMLLQSEISHVSAFLSKYHAKVLQPIDMRVRVVYLVNNYSRMLKRSRDSVWDEIFDVLYDLYGVNVHLLNRAESENNLDAVVRAGHLERLYGIAEAYLNI